MSFTDWETLASAQHEFAGLVTGLDGAEGWLRSDRAIPAHERIRVYANAYFSRIHDVLRSDYGALHAALGADAFHDLVKLYLISHPSRSFSLRYVGERLPAFLAGPIGEPFLRRWPFAAELARLEWAITDVFDAADTPVLTRAALAALPPEAWEPLRFELIAAHRLLRSAWPVHRIRDAWETNTPLPELEPASTWILVHRRDEQVLYRAVSDIEAQALKCVQERLSFGDVCARIAELTGEAQAPVRALELLERWLVDEVLAASTGLVPRGD
jgi:hypothetical protein